MVRLNKEQCAFDLVYALWWTEPGPSVEVRHSTDFVTRHQTLALLLTWLWDLWLSTLISRAPLIPPPHFKILLVSGSHKAWAGLAEKILCRQGWTSFWTSCLHSELELQRCTQATTLFYSSMPRIHCFRGASKKIWFRRSSVCSTKGGKCWRYIFIAILVLLL